MINTERKNGKAAEKYASFVGKHVIIYYRDMRDNDRKIHGIIASVEGDNIYLHNGEWSGMLNCRNARVTLVSSVQGWNNEFESKEEKGLFGKIFRR